MKQIIKESQLRKIVIDTINEAIRQNTIISDDIFDRCRTLSERINYLRVRVKEANTISEDVMSNYYGIRSNGCKPMLIERITLNRIIQKHGANGVINISACRTKNSDEENKTNSQSLLNDIKQFGFSYLPSYGGYRNIEVGEEADFEPSFIVFNYKSGGGEGNWDRLYKFALEMCGKYDQDSVLIKASGKNPIYVDRNGNKCNKKETDKVFKNDPKQEYFTSLKDKNSVDKEVEMKIKAMYKSYCQRKGIAQNIEDFKKYREEHIKDIKKIGRRYTYDIQFDECYVNPIPMTLNEQKRRTDNGEIMLFNLR